MSGGLYGKAALITNATDAVGLAISRRLGLAGAKVFLTDSNKEQLEKVVSELSDVGVVASGAVVDLAQASQHQPLFTEVSQSSFVTLLGKKQTETTGLPRPQPRTEPRKGRHHRELED